MILEIFHSLFLKINFKNSFFIFLIFPFDNLSYSVFLLSFLLVFKQRKSQQKQVFINSDIKQASLMEITADN